MMKVKSGESNITRVALDNLVRMLSVVCLCWEFFLWNRKDIFLCVKFWCSFFIKNSSNGINELLSCNSWRMKCPYQTTWPNDGTQFIALTFQQKNLPSQQRKKNSIIKEYPKKIIVIFFLKFIERESVCMLTTFQWAARKFVLIS